MPLFNLYNETTGELLRARQNHGQQPPNLPGKGWTWSPHVEPEIVAGEVATWDAVTRAFVATPRPPADLAARAAELTAEVQRQAEAERMRHLTPGAGKANEYRRKEEEALAWTAAGGGAVADPTPYPFAAALAAETGATVENVLTTWKARADAWVALGAAIGAIEDAAVSAIATAAAAEDWAAMEAAAQVTWPGAV